MQRQMKQSSWNDGFKRQRKSEVFGCLEVKIGRYGKERVDYMTFLKLKYYNFCNDSRVNYLYIAI